MKSKKKEYYIGIDFGTSNSCIGIYMNGIVKIPPNRIGERITPSIVIFLNNKKIVVGEEALNERKENINNFIYEIKRFIGLNYEEFEEGEFKKYLNYEIENKEGLPKVKLNIDGEIEYKSAEEISALIIKKVLQSAEDFIAEEENQEGLTITKAVITVPAHFNENQKRAVRAAAKMAGIEIARIINEPTAAALAYGIGNDLIPEDQKKINIFSSVFDKNELEVAPIANEISKSEERVIIFDLGGGTLDITLLNIKKNHEGQLTFEVELTNGDIHLGGSDFDNMLIDYCIKEFCRSTDNDENEVRKDKNACQRLKIKCENAKKLLSIKNNIIIDLDNFFNEDDLCIKMTITLFESICKDLFNRISKIINEVLEEVGKNISYVDKVILVGGATRMCGIKELLKKIFGEDKIKDNLNPDEAVAIGATLEAAKIEINNKMDFVLQDIIPYNLGIGILNKDPNDIRKGDKMDIIIKKYSKIPSSSLNELPKNLNVLKIYEGNSNYVNQNTKLGEIIIDKLPKVDIFKYKVKFTVDVNGKLTVQIINDSLGIIKEKDLNITKAFSSGKKIKISQNSKISSISKMVKNIKDTKVILEKNYSDLNKRIKNLKDCCQYYEELIDLYMAFIKNNESIYEKIFIYTKELFKLYLERIILKEKTKDNINEIINKIKIKMNNLISVIGYVEELLIIFTRIRESHKNEFYEIFVNFIELLNNEGINRKKKKKYSRYYCKLYFEKAFYASKKYIVKNDLYIIDKRIKENYEKQKAINEEELKKVNSFTNYIEVMVNEGQFLFGNTGYTQAAQKIEKFKKNMKQEDIQDILDLFHNMADSFDKNKRSLGEAYCLANIIDIYYSILKITDYDRLYKYLARFEIIMEGREDEKYEWYAKIKEIIKNIQFED